VTFSEIFFSAAVRTGEDPTAPNGMPVAFGACPALM
jgi:hypothetical protein